MLTDNFVHYLFVPEEDFEILPSTIGLTLPILLPPPPPEQAGTSDNLVITCSGAAEIASLRSEFRGKSHHGFRLEIGRAHV